MKKIVIPIDFTEVAETALNYASSIASDMNSELLLVHIVKDPGQVESAENKLTEFIKKSGSFVKAPMSPQVRVGNIFEDIPQVAEEESAQLVVMGTHGLQGMQFIVGSRALRVVAESNVPFIIVQNNSSIASKISKILVPLDLHKETKQKLHFAADVAAHFKAEIHLISPKDSDEYFNNRIIRNVAYSEGYLEEKNIPYKSIVTDHGLSGFTKDLIRYASENHIDLICIANNSDENFIHAFGRDVEQQIITNEYKIPVMILNPLVTLLDSRSIFAQ